MLTWLRLSVDAMKKKNIIRTRTPQQQQNTIDSESGTGITGFGIFNINRKKS